MKLGKTSWLILIIGFLVVAFGSLGATRSQQISQHNQLAEELSVATTRMNALQLKQLYAQKEELDKRLSEAQSQVDTAKTELRQPIESIDVTDSLFRIAEICGVEIINLSSSDLGKDKLPGITTASVRLTLTVEGDVLNLISFITRLNNDFITGLVTSAEIITQAEDPEQPEATTGEGTGGSDNVTGESDNLTEEQTIIPQPPQELETPSANIRLVIHTYQG